MSARDFLGYGETPPDPAWPGGARVAVSVVVNVEEGAELSIGDGDEVNEAVYEVQDAVAGARDPCMESHFEYGTRAGFPRILAALDEAGIPATFSMCGRSAARSPWLAAAAAARGHEISCHGWRWESHAGMAIEAEREAIARTVHAIRAAAGCTPVGWHTRSAPSENTRGLLIEAGNFLYDSDAYSDDLPIFVTVGRHRHLVLPYAFDTNDMHFHQGRQRFVLASHFADYVCDSFDQLWREGARHPKMMSVGLHLRMIGRPGRIAGLVRCLEHMQRKGGVWFARRDAIARHWRERFPEAARVPDAAVGAAP